jgi:hypothetical protein
MATVTKNRTYGKIAGFWVITQKLNNIRNLTRVKMTSTARSNYPAILKKILELLPFFHQIVNFFIFFILYFDNYKR